MDWTIPEVELIVADYFRMLYTEISGLKYSKAEHRRKLTPLLNHRSDGSIEFKLQNISAVLVNLGQPYIKGYLPRFNYQKILEDVVLDYLINNIQIETSFRHFSDKEIKSPNDNFNFNKILVDPPKLKRLEDPIAQYKIRNPIKINYLEREQMNQKLGELGEEIVLRYEQWHLIQAGKVKLAEQVEWISKNQGDGSGFDILSRNPNGTDKYIEVKTTKLAKETPFFFTRNELEFSIDHSKQFYLYRLFNVEEQAKMFIKNGDLKTICHSIPITFKGFVN
ncbi:MAG: DUF3883 domain-containing protein [Bacteroidetes bacterium]|jgi:hypothetical protein|nr:DUF3883 domain-containing protein [Bacteroidota bacterium]